ncbi:MAG: cytochrome c biogenesis protein CcsA [Verrucomicrobiae bacterium]|nr:cytochrome c biogenesis protein CcsA [Verrucomicrobiae bacterium]
MKMIWIMTVWMALTVTLRAEIPAGADLSDLERIPIQNGGRIKPLYSFAEESFQMLTGGTTFKPGFADYRQGALRNLLLIWANPDRWSAEEIILVDHAPLREEMGLDPTRKMFAIHEIAGNEVFRKKFAENQKLRARERNPRFDKMQREVNNVANRLHLWESLLQGDVFTIVPPQNAESNRWLTLPQFAKSGADPARKQALFKPFLELVGQVNAAPETGIDPRSFEQNAQTFAREMRGLTVGTKVSHGLIGLEVLYQKLHPFRLAWVLYLLAGIVLLATTVWQRRGGYGLAWGLVGVGLLAQGFGFVCRVLISGRPPVSNMYETVIWMAFISSVFAIVLEAIYRKRYYFIASIPITVVMLYLADSLPAILDGSIQPLVPVLQSQFWLIIHVLPIVSSYGAFALAAMLANIVFGYLIFSKGHRVPSELYTFIYRTIQIGVFLLASGTILGGVWANYSWGRFWDWDPKETWALVTLLVFLAVLHGRIAGAWSGFGLAVGSVAGFMSVVMAWYGVNFLLGVGLHSYGVGAGGLEYVITYVVVQLAFMTWGIQVYRTGPSPADPVRD